MTKAITTKNAALDLLRDSYEVEARPQKISLPRLTFVSQDQTEGKGKARKVTVEAGTFFTETKTDEVDKETGKNIWERTELGLKIEGVIIYQRKQLSHYDEASGQYTSSPIYDSNDDVVPLFRGGQKIDSGTPQELKGRDEYQGTTAKGKPTSNLKENKVLYIIYEDDVYQMNIKGSSLYSFQAYARTGITIPAVITAFNSEPKENGAIEWNQMTFKATADLPSKKVVEIAQQVVDIRDTIQAEKAQYSDDSKAEIDPKEAAKGF